MELKKVGISEVKPWDKNPRNIRTVDFERLKNQIKKLGIYKPLVVYEDNGNYITLGGNMRLEALKELKHKQVDVSIVHPKTEVEKIEYNLSDNDRAGEYDELKLAELVTPHLKELNLETFKVDLGEPVDLSQVIAMFAPTDEDEQGRLDTLTEKVKVKCPECGFEFIPEEYGLAPAGDEGREA